MILVNPDSQTFVGRSTETVLDGWIFSGTSSAVRDVYIVGRRVVHNRRHNREDELFERFRNAVERLTP